MSDAVRHWQGLALGAVVAVGLVAIVLYLVIFDRRLLARRMQSQEARPAQRILIVVIRLAVLGLVVTSDHEYKHSGPVLAAAWCVVGDVLVATGFAITLLVFRTNSFTSTTIRVEEGQTVSDQGPYAIVRHPFYLGLLLVLFGVPLALGTPWGSLFAIATLIAFVARLLDEERMLFEQLPGYADYCARVKYHLIPKVW